MHVSPGSASSAMLGVFGELGGEMEKSVDIKSQTALVLFTSLAFLIPAFTSWRMHRFWHSFLFGVMTVVCASYHFCRAGMPQQLGLHMKCSATTTHFLSHVFFMWVYFCFLQMAFLVMGPEDPHMQWLLSQAAPGSPSCKTPDRAPFDAVIMARVIPAVVLCMFHFLHASWDTEEIHWQSLLLNELLLLVCSAGFWMHRSRQARAADVLIRYKYWHRLLHHGFIPAMMLFWIFCIMGFTDLQALHTMWHVVLALFAVSLLRTVLVGDSTSPSAKVFDISPHNPNVAHVLLGSVALIVLPTTIIGASFDWCAVGESHWPTIATATICQPGGYFVAIVSVPAFAGVATVFWLIDSTASGKTNWIHFTKGKPWEQQETSSNPQQLALGKRLGCALGFGGAFCGLMASLIMKGTPIQNVLNLFCSIMCLGLIMIAMALTVLSSDTSTQSSRFRRSLTMFVCLPTMIVHIMLILSDQCLPMQQLIPHSVYAITEYSVILLLSLWPLTWASEVQDTWQRNVSGNFAWPTTTWRFV